MICDLSRHSCKFVCEYINCEGYVNIIVVIYEKQSLHIKIFLSFNIKIVFHVPISCCIIAIFSAITCNSKIFYVATEELAICSIQKEYVNEDKVKRVIRLLNSRESNFRRGSP